MKTLRDPFQKVLRPLLFVVVLAWPGVARARDKARPPKDWNPPALTFPDDRITLREAVRLTLENDPNLLLQEQATRSQRGFFMTQTGVFDPTINGDATWMFTQQSLSLLQISTEQGNRTDIDQEIATAKTSVAQAQFELQEAGRIAANPGTYVSTSNDINILQLQLQVSQFNQLIASTTDPIQKAALIASRGQLLQAALASFAANLTGAQTSQQNFQTQRNNLGDIPKVIQEDNVTANLSMSFPYRDGVTAGLFATGTYDANGYKGKPKQTDFGGLGIEDTYNIGIGFSLNASLLRGRGDDATGAQEKSAGIDYEASGLILKHTATSSVENTIVAYWNLVAAQQYLEIARKAAHLGDQRLEVTDALIAGDELPRAEKARSLASQATDAAQVSSAERAVNEARVTLAKTIGLTVAEPANAPLAADEFPATPDAATLANLLPGPYIELAFAKRWDRQAAVKLRQSKGVLTVAARTALRPQLDFSGQISATSNSETSLANTAGDWVAPSWQAGFVFSKPVGNNAARGALLSAEADLATSSINATDLDRNIKANVVSLVSSIRRASEQIALLDEAIRFYGQTIDSETERYRSGQSSLLDTIVTQDLQTTTLVTWATARQQLASFIAQLRFETGTLVEARGDLNVVLPEVLVTLPAPGAR